MHKKPSTKISITLNDILISRLDGLAERLFTSRSYIIRIALAEYLNKPENAPTEINHILYAGILAEHPDIDPADTELLEILRMEKIGRDTEV